MRSFLTNLLAVGVLFIGALAAPIDLSPRPVPPTPGPGRRVDAKRITCYSSPGIRVKKGVCLVSSTPKGMILWQTNLQRIFGNGGIPLPQLWRHDQGRCGASLQLFYGVDQGSIQLSYEDIDERISDIMIKCEREGKYGGGFYDLAPHPFYIDLYSTHGPGILMEAANSTTIRDDNVSSLNISASNLTMPAWIPTERGLNVDVELTE